MGGNGRGRLQLVGVRSGRLTVIRLYDIEEYESPKGKRSTYTRWLLRCDCGKTVVVRGTEIMYQIRRAKRGLSNRWSSCGCYHSEMVGEQGRRMHQEGFMKVAGLVRNPVTGRYENSQEVAV